MDFRLHDVVKTTQPLTWVNETIPAGTEGVVVAIHHKTISIEVHMREGMDVVDFPDDWLERIVSTSGGVTARKIRDERGE